MQISISNAIGGGGGTQGGGTPTPPPFSNVDSFSFDGVDEYFVGVGGYTELSSGNAMSVSVWFKSSNYTSLGRLLFVGKHVEIYQNSALYSNTRGCFYYRLRGNFGNSFATLGGATNLGVGNLVDGQWHHLCFTWDGATTTAKVYEDGVLKVTNTSASGTLNSSTTESYSIGAENNGNNPIDGLIDEVGVWTTALSFADVTAIYNNGVPNNLNDLSTPPTTWQRMGDNATWNGATWTMTDVNGGYTNRSINMVEANRTTDVPTASSFTNTKSILLDGVDDYVDIANPTSFSDIGDFSVSAWLKFTSSASTKNALNIRDNRYLYISGGKILGAYKNATNQFRSISTPLTYNDGNYHHVLFVKNSTNMILFVDGTQVAINSNGGATFNGGSTYARIGARASAATASNFFPGNIDELAFFNSDQSVNISTIYNNGVPNDLANLSPFSWWRCGDNDTAPTLTDNGSAGNNGTMTNFSTFSTDVPTAPSFTNTKSILLDGVDDYVTFGNMSSFSGATQFTFSGWYKFNSVPARESIFSILVDNNNFFDVLMYDALTYVQLKVGGTSQFVQFNSSFFTSNQWAHLVIAYDNTQSTNRDKLKVYINNVDITYTISTAITLALPTGTNTVTIGETSRLSGVFLNGNVDECAVFNTQLSASDVTTIWNNGVPSDISSINGLTNWWRCGDGDTAPILTDNIGSNNGTMTNFSTFSTDVPFNYKSIQLDGVDDRVQLSSDFVASSEFTVSFWMKPTAFGVNGSQYVLGQWGVNPNNIKLDQAGQIHFKIGGTGLIISEAAQGGSNNLVLNIWQHLLFVRDSSNNIKCFRNGVSYGSTSGLSNTNTLTYNSIGRVITNTFGFSGGLDEIAFWNSDQSANLSAIYNGGVPNDIASLSPLSWWRCGDGDTAPTLTDNGSASNDGTMTNFTTFSTDVPT